MDFQPLKKACCISFDHLRELAPSSAGPPPTTTEVGKQLQSMNKPT